jgi:flagellar hook protein FlgE
MASEVSTIQSLKAVDAWIDVINSNINGGVRTAFKASRLKFGGSNSNVDRPGNASSLPLQFPEPSLTTTNSVIDFSQGAITASTENTHLAIQGDGFFLLASPETIDPTNSAPLPIPNARFLLTRDGEFHTDSNGFLRTSFGYYLVTADLTATGQLDHSTTRSGTAVRIRAVYNDLDLPMPPATTYPIGLSQFLTGEATTNIHNGAFPVGDYAQSLIRVAGGRQSLTYTEFGSTVFSFGYTPSGGAALGTINANIRLEIAPPADNVIRNKSLEASNASMTQSVPELSLAQKLFSALTKVLQTKQTNVDGVLNLVR